MADTTTVHYSWVMPQNMGSDDTWGLKVNGTIAAIDAQVWGNSHGQNIGAYTATGVPATFSFYNSAAPSGQQLRWQWQMDNAAESGTNIGSNLNLLAYDNTGVALTPAPMTISRSAGVTLGGAVTLGSLGAYGRIKIPATVSGASHGGMGFQMYGSSPASTDALWIDLSNIVNVTGDFNVSGNAFKPGGGPWTAISDARIKTVEAEYLHGLEEVCQLRPVAYRYKGNDGGAHDPDKEHIGLVAQEVEEVMPEMVSMKEGVIDGEPVSDLRTLDTTALVFALVNAVKQLNARIAELEAR